MDLDGTALQEDHESFTPGLNEMLLRVHEKGIIVIPCTGRPYGFLPSVLEKKAEWMSLAICADGAEIRNLKDGTILSGEYMKSEDVLSMMKLSEDPDIAFEAMTDNCVYLSEESLRKEQRDAGRLSYHLNHVLKKKADISAINKDLERIEKMNLFCMEETSRKKIRKVSEEMKVSCAETDFRHFEVTSIRASKAEGMKKVCQYFRIPLSETMAIGDSWNDSSVLSMAGISVAMGNAPEALRKDCTYVTGRYDEDGVADFLERLL